jgi:drug/metabolite transporter (DMT)-like permease
MSGTVARTSSDPLRAAAPSRTGYAGVCLAAVLWAVGGAVARYLIDRGASPVELVEARAWISAAGLGVVWLARGGLSERGAARGHRLVLVVFGLAIAAANFFYYSSLALLSVAVAITVQYTAPGLVVVWSTVVRRQRPSGRVVGALVCAFAGVALLAELPVFLARGEAAFVPLGFAAALGAAVAFAAYIVTGERVGRALGAQGALVRGFAVASVFWGVVQLVRGRPDTLLDPRFIPGVIFLAVFTTIAPFYLFVWGLERLDASRAGIVSTLEPLTAALLAYLWLGQGLSGVQIGGGVLVVTGIVVVQAERPVVTRIPPGE